MGAVRDILEQTTPQRANKIQLAPNTSGLPNYDFSVFPSSLQLWATELQRVHNIEAAYTLTSAIVAAGTLIGNKYIAQVKGDHLAPPIFFALLIGNSGAGKSPAIDYAFKHITEHCIRKHKEYQQANKDYKQREAEAKAADTEFTEAPPKFNDRYVFQNTTVEALYKHLEDSYNAVTFITDEYKDFFDNVVNNRYGNGSDRGKVLSWIDGKAIFVDTKKDGSRLIERTNISIIGGTQPDRLPELIGNASDGFTERFLYAYNTRPLKAYSYDTINPSLLHDYNNTMQKLIELPYTFDSYDNLTPVRVPFDNSAFAIYVQWCEAMTERGREAETELMKTIYIKMQSFCPRIALVLQMLYYVSNEGNNVTITERAINGAISLMTYYIETSLKVHGEGTEANPTSRLTSQQSKVYEALPTEFATAEGIEIASRFQMSDKSFKRFIQRKQLFTKIKHGHYERIY